MDDAGDEIGESEGKGEPKCQRGNPGLYVLWKKKIFHVEDLVWCQYNLGSIQAVERREQVRGAKGSPRMVAPRNALLQEQNGCGCLHLCVASEELYSLTVEL